MNKQVARELVKIAKSLLAADFKKGDICTVDMAKAKVQLGGGFAGPHHLKVLRDTIRMGDGKVEIEKIYSNGSVDLVPANNPGAAILGPVTVPMEVLKK